MTLISDSPERRTVFAYSLCSALSSVSRRSPVIPITPFMGVRISWLIVARNWLRASAALLAAAF